MRRKARKAEQKKRLEKRIKNSKKNKYKEMKEKGLLGKMEIEKYNRTINDLSSYKFIQDSLVYNQLKRLNPPKREDYQKLSKLYNLIVENKRYDNWIDEQF